jgi:ORF6N domain-containing protein
MIRKPIVKTRQRKVKPEASLSAGLAPIEVIERRIFTLRGHRVLLDQDLAKLYGVQLKRLNEQVKRNRDRFPEDFTFQLTFEEGKAVRAVRSQNATLQNPLQHLRFPPYVFTEHGAMMLANVLKSPLAVRASIQVVRAFVRLRRMLAWSNQIAKKIEALERRVGEHDAELQHVLRTLRKLIEPPPPPPKRPIGFLSSVSAKRVTRNTEAAVPPSIPKKSRGAGAI